MRAQLLYLDQSYWGRLVSSHVDLGERVTRLVENGTLCVPLSSMVLMETLKAAPRVRHALVPFLRQVSTRRYVVNMVRIWRLELEAWEKQDPSWVRSRLVTDDPIEALGPMSKPLALAGKVARGAYKWWCNRRDGPHEDMLSLMNRAADSQQINDGVNRILARGAADANNAPGAIPVPREMAKGIGVSPRRMPTQAEFRSAFRTISVQETLQRTIRERRERGLEGNDLVDVSFLAFALPYFDLVTTDRSMGARVQEAALGDLARAGVLRRIEELEEVVGNLEEGA